MLIMLPVSMACVAATCTAPAQASHGGHTITLVSARTVEPRPGVPHDVFPLTTVTVRLDSDTGLLMNTQIKFQWIGHLRPIHGLRLITDGHGRLAACNFDDGANINDACLIVARQHNVDVVYDFSARVVALCRRDRRLTKLINPSFVAVDGVRGDIVSIYSPSFEPGPNLHLSVKALPSGRYQIVGYRTISNLKDPEVL